MEEICNVHRRHTVLNKFSARRDSYTATMQRGEKMLIYINRIVIDDKQMAMAVLNGLASRFGTIVPALDAIGYDDESITFDKVRSRLLQEENRWNVPKWTTGIAQAFCSRS